ncbi:hypothetical protein MNEG_12873, partial [Monoraphidium neglectum]
PRLPAPALGRAVWAAGRLRLWGSGAAGAGGDASAAVGGDDDLADPSVLLTRALELLTEWRAPQLIQFLSGAARLRLAPGQAWLRAVAAAPALARPSALGGERLVLLLSALAALGYAPPAGWVDAMDTVLQASYVEGPSMAAAARSALAELRGREAPSGAGGGGRG